MALVGGVAAMLLFSQGLLVWAGFVGWVAFLDAGGDSAALSKTIAGTVFGALLAWATIILSVMIPVPADSWLWIPRIGVAIAVSLFVLVMAGRSSMLARVSTSLLGYAAVLGATAAVIAGQAGDSMLLSPHQSNPLVNSVLSLVLGAIFGLVSNKFAEALTN